MIDYSAFVEICHVSEPANFGGFHVKTDGLYTIVPDDDAPLSPTERAVLSWHPTGNHFTPALPLPCTLDELRSFVAEAGLQGCIDEEVINAMKAQAEIQTNAPIAESQYVPLVPLLKDYWDKPLSELPKELRASVSRQKTRQRVGMKPKLDANGEIVRGADGSYPVWEDVFAEYSTGEFIHDWDVLTKEEREQAVMQIDAKHDHEAMEEAQRYFELQDEKQSIESEIRRWELANHGSVPSEMKAQEDKLAALRGKLAEIMKELETPDAGKEAKPSGKKGITKGEVISAFDGMHFNRDKWSKYLGDPPEWLKECRVALGSRKKKVSATWDPVLIAAALFDKGIPIKKLDTVFVRLKDWADEWLEASESFRD